MYKAMAGTLSPNKLYTTFYNNLFVLKTTVKTNGQQVEIDFSNDELTLRCRSPELSICFREVSAQLSALLRNYGVCQVNSVWCGAEPFLHVSVSAGGGGGGGGGGREVVSYIERSLAVLVCASYIYTRPYLTPGAIVCSPAPQRREVCI